MLFATFVLSYFYSLYLLYLAASLLLLCNYKPIFKYLKPIYIISIVVIFIHSIVFIANIVIIAMMVRSKYDKENQMR